MKFQIYQRFQGFGDNFFVSFRRKGTMGQSL